MNPILLPLEVVANIVSRLNQLDCVRCMRVSRQWYDTIPLCATGIWKKIDVCERRWKRANCRMLRCIGTHTEHVFIYQINVAAVLNKLQAYHCSNIMRLVIHETRPQPNLYSYHVEDSTIMSSVLMFSHTLKELCIARHVSSLEVLPLLANLPNLSHLTLLNGTTYLSSLSQYTDASFDNLVYLRLGIVCDFDIDIIPLLRRCPNISALLVHPRQVVRPNTDVTGPKDFDILAQLCSKIRYFAWNPFTFHSIKYYQGIPALADNHHHRQGIKMFEFIGVGPGRDDNGTFTRIVPVIVRAQDTLEHLKLYFDPFRTVLFPAGELSHHRFSQLKSLSLGGIHMTADEWGLFFKGLDNIWFLEIHIHSNDYPMGAFIVEKLGCLKNLKRLRLVWSYFTHARLPALNNIHLLSNCNQLQCLELQRVPLLPHGLLDLCKISSLKKLDLLLYRGDEINYKWLWPFAEKLKNIHGLEYLTLNNFLFLNNGVVVHLTTLENLVQVTICHCRAAHETGVDGFISYCRKVKRIKADCCDRSSSSVSASYTVWNATE